MFIENIFDCGAWFDLEPSIVGSSMLFLAASAQPPPDSLILEEVRLGVWVAEPRIEGKIEDCLFGRRIIETIRYRIEKGQCYRKENKLKLVNVQPYHQLTSVIRKQKGLCRNRAAPPWRDRNYNSVLLLILGSSPRAVEGRETNSSKAPYIAQPVKVAPIYWSRCVDRALSRQSRIS